VHTSIIYENEIVTLLTEEHYHEEVIFGAAGAAGDDAGVGSAGLEQMMDEGLDLVEEDVVIGLVLVVAPVEPVLFLARVGGSSARDSKSIETLSIGFGGTNCGGLVVRVEFDDFTLARKKRKTTELLRR
jgi:hypothetical protein